MTHNYNAVATQVNVLPSQEGSFPVQLPFVWQTRVLFPSILYPVLQEYLTTEPNVVFALSTSPFIISSAPQSTTASFDDKLRRR